MPQDTVGSIRSFSVEGITFRVPADANFSRKPIRFENTAVATSGKAMQKKTRVVPVLEGVTLAVNANEMEALKAFAEGLDPIKVSYETAAGDVYRCTGQIDVEAHESEEGKANCTVHPQDDWVLFPRS